MAFPDPLCPTNGDLLGMSAESRGFPILPLVTQAASIDWFTYKCWGCQNMIDYQYYRHGTWSVLPSGGRPVKWKSSPNIESHTLAKKIPRVRAVHSICVPKIALLNKLHDTRQDQRTLPSTTKSLRPKHASALSKDNTTVPSAVIFAIPTNLGG
jgi:hypothetical protein